ncbi:MAG: carboxypeptidase regulatory-like domain-containing protein [Cytophagales bacterium]|nr:carboxypeptidase-like regulatory domain-containing protein [Bernardetiaceae bacterium]MDW8203918.1 carboxypeptidase regulatory-like domain-containing protein [Cytophagales bacterium]
MRAHHALVSDSLCLPAHFLIKGVVVDSLTKRPVQAAWIFVNNTTLDTVSLRSGAYRLSGVPMGRHEIVVSATGYLPRRIIADGTKEPALTDTICLLPLRPKSLEEMLARTKYKEWNFFYHKFKAHFLGTSDWASEVRILNPWVIYFEYTNSKEWRALANDLLLIENMALGYRIRCYLEQMAVAGQVAVFDGCLFFEPIATIDPHIAEKWRKNRQVAYRGSLMQFLRCLATAENDSLFKVFRLRGTEYFYHTQEPASKVAQSPTSVIQPTESPYEFSFVFARDQMQINYYGAGEDMAYRRFVNRMTRIQRLPERFRASWLASRSERVMFNRLGYFYNPLTVEVYGYWEYQRIAERLPIDYNP